MGWRLSFANVALLVALLSCSGNSVRASDVRAIKTGGVQGVIVDAATAQAWGVRVSGAQGFWTPTAEDIKAAESHLQAALEKGVKDPATIVPGRFSELSRKFSSQEIAGVLEHAGKCRRQYFGVVVDGKKCVYLNAFPASEPVYEKNRFVMVSDGGTWFWRILYRLDTGTFSGFSANGEA